MLELCTADEATMALGMDGIRFSDQVLKIRRPRDFGLRDDKAADESARRSKRLDVVSHKVKDGPHTVLLGNVPSSLPPTMVRTQLLPLYGTASEPPTTHWWNRARLSTRFLEVPTAL
jgi:hypothetical protein